MTKIRSRRSSTWRRIAVDGVPYTWTVSTRKVPLDDERLVSRLEVLVLVRGADRKIVARATFHGHLTASCAYAWQSLSVRPAIVAELVRRALRTEPTLDHAETLFPAAITPGDLADETLRAACAKWFVPYPGRARLASALQDSGRDFAKAAERLSTPGGRMSADQVEYWARELGLC